MQGWLIKSMCMLTRAESVLASTVSLPRGVKVFTFCKNVLSVPAATERTKERLDLSVGIERTDKQHSVAGG